MMLNSTHVPLRSRSTLASVLALALVLPVILLGGCAAINDSAMRAWATPMPAMALVGDRLLSGRALVYADRTGSITLESDTEPALNCMVRMRFTASRTGTAHLDCSDGSVRTLPFTALSETRGYAREDSGAGRVSMTWGLTPTEATVYLVPPAGKRLRVDEDSLRIE